MFKKTADLLGNTDLPRISTPKIVGNVQVNSDGEFTGLEGNSTCEFRVEIKSSSSPYSVTTEVFTFDSDSVYSMSSLVASLNGQATNVVFDYEEGCLNISSVFSGHKSYIKVLAKTTVSAFDPLPLLGLFAYPHPSSISTAGDLENAPVKPDTQGNKHGTQFVARHEDKLSSSVNRGLVSVGYNTEHNKKSLEKSIAIGQVIELDASVHSYRFHSNAITGEYEYVWLGDSGLNDSVDVALSGRRVYVGGQSSSSTLSEIEQVFLLKNTDNRYLLGSKVGAVVSYSPNPAGTTTILGASFDANGEVVSPLSDSNSLYSDYGNVLGVDIPVYPSQAISGFTKSTMVVSSASPNVEVGFKVVISGSNTSPFSNDGEYVVSEVLSEYEFELKSVLDGKVVLNDAPNGGSFPTATISTGGLFINNATVVFEPGLVFPPDNKIRLCLYVESSIEEADSSVIVNSVDSRLVHPRDTVGLDKSFKGANPSLEAGFYINQELRGIEIVSESTARPGQLDPIDYEGPFTGEITTSWVLTVASGGRFSTADVGALFKVEDKWARAVSLVDYRTLQLVPFKKTDSISASSSAVYYKYAETSGIINIPGSIISYMNGVPGFTAIDETSTATGAADKSFIKLTQIATTVDGTSLLAKTASAVQNSEYITLDFNPIESGVIRAKYGASSSDYGKPSTVVCITTGASIGWYAVKTMSSTQLELEFYDGGSFRASATETVSVSFYAPTMTVDSLIGAPSGKLAVPALSVRGHHRFDLSNSNYLSAALHLDWDGAGAGIVSSINRGGFGSSSSGNLLEARLAPPAKGLYLDIEGNSAGTSNTLSGSYGLSVETSSEYVNIQNLDTYRTATNLAPESAINVMNTGSDSNLLLARGTIPTAYWDSPVADIRNIGSEVYGAGQAMSVQGSWYSRLSSQIYLQEDGVVRAQHLVGSKDSGSLGLKDVVAYQAWPSDNPVNDIQPYLLDPDYAIFSFPHQGILKVGIGYVHVEPRLLPGLNVYVDNGNGTVINTPILGVYVDTAATPNRVLMAVNEPSMVLTVNGTVIKVESPRLGLYAEVQDYLSFNNGTSSVPSLAAGGVSVADYLATPSDEYEPISAATLQRESAYSGAMLNRAGEDYTAIDAAPGATTADSTQYIPYSTNSGESRAPMPNTFVLFREALDSTTSGSFEAGDTYVFEHLTQNSANGQELYYTSRHLAYSSHFSIYSYYGIGGALAISRKGYRDYAIQLERDRVSGTTPGTSPIDSGTDTVRVLKRIGQLRTAFTKLKMRVNLMVPTTGSVSKDFTFEVLESSGNGALTVLATHDATLTFTSTDSTVYEYEFDLASEALLLSLSDMRSLNKNIGLILGITVDMPYQTHVYIRELEVFNSLDPLLIPTHVHSSGIVKAAGFALETPVEQILSVGPARAQLLRYSGYGIGYGYQSAATGYDASYGTLEGAGPGCLRSSSSTGWYSPVIPSSFFTVNANAAEILINTCAYDPAFFAYYGDSANDREDVIWPGKTGFIVPLDLEHGAALKQIEVHMSVLPQISPVISNTNRVAFAVARYSVPDTILGANDGFTSDYYADNWDDIDDYSYGYTIRLVRTSVGDANITKRISPYLNADQALYGYQDVLATVDVTLPTPSQISDSDYIDVNIYGSGTVYTSKEHFEKSTIDLNIPYDDPDSKRSIVDRRQYDYAIVVEFYALCRKWSPSMSPLLNNALSLGTFSVAGPSTPAVDMERVFHPVNTNVNQPSFGKIKFRGAQVKYLKTRI